MTWSCLGFPFALVPTLTFCALSSTRVTLEDHVRGIASLVSQRIGILTLVKRVFVNTSVLLRCYYAFVIPILEYCFSVWGSAAECYFQVLERHLYSVGRLCPDQTFLSSCYRRCTSLRGQYKLKKNYFIIHCLAIIHRTTIVQN